MSFASPLWFLLLVPVAARVWLAFRDRRARIADFSFSSLSLVASRRSFFAATSWLPMLLETAALIFLVVALARPQRITSMATDERYGIDIVVCLDSSGSMAAEDFRPRDRFTVAKSVIGDFIERRVNDRIGIVTFGNRAATRVPITFDRDAARSILSDAQIGQNGDGTAIGQAIATAVNRLRGSKSRSKVVILVTDGVNNAGSIEPATAASIAAGLGIKVYTIGVGSQGEVPIRIKAQDPFTGEIVTQYQYIRADLDEAMLSGIATTTNGAYFRAVDPNAMQAILDRIDKLEKSRLGAPRINRIDELYLRPLLYGVALMLLSLLAGETRWMRLPA